MTAVNPSIVIWIEPATQQVDVEFRAQKLSPAEYGIIIATLVTHIAREFRNSNPRVSEEQLIVEIMKGLQAGLNQRDDLVLPTKPH